MINITRKKVVVLTVVAPPDTNGIPHQVIIEPNSTWGDVKHKFATNPNLLASTLSLADSRSKPAQQGSKFQHYSLSATGPAIEDEHVLVQEDTIYAVFSNTVTVTVKDEGKIIFTQPVKIGCTLRKAVRSIHLPLKDGFKFVGYEEQGKTIDLDTIVNEDKELSAKYASTESVVEISFDTGDNGPMEPITVPKGSQWIDVKKLILYPTPKNNTTFFKWWSNSSGGSAIDDGVLFNTNTQIHGVFGTGQKITLAFDTDGGTTIKPISVASGTCFGYVMQLIPAPSRVTDPERLDTFAGWFDKPFADEVLKVTDVFDTDTNLYAQWIHRIDVTVKNNGPERTTSKEANYWPYAEYFSVDPLQTENIPPKHTFKHWSLSKDGKAIDPKNPSGMFVHDADLWAVYDPYVKVTTDEGKVVEEPIGTTWETILPKLSANPRDGYGVHHWSLQAEGVAVDPKAPVKADTKIFAVWKKTWTVTFNANGGTPTPEPIQVFDQSTWGDNKSKVQETTKAGYKLSGWNVVE